VPVGDNIGTEVEPSPNAAEVEALEVMFMFLLNAAEAGIGTTTNEGGKAGWSGM
jgi:hypothetical protein